MWRPSSTPWGPELSTPYSSTIGSFSSFFTENFISIYNEIWAYAPMPLPQLPSMPPSNFISFFLWWPTSPIVAPVTQVWGYCISGNHIPETAWEREVQLTYHASDALRPHWVPLGLWPQSAFIMQILDGYVLSWNTEVLQEAEAEAKEWFVCLGVLITLNIG